MQKARTPEDKGILAAAFCQKAESLGATGEPTAVKADIRHCQWLLCAGNMVDRQACAEEPVMTGVLI